MDPILSKCIGGAGFVLCSLGIIALPLAATAQEQHPSRQTPLLNSADHSTPQQLLAEEEEDAVWETAFRHFLYTPQWRTKELIRNTLSGTAEQSLPVPVIYGVALSDLVDSFGEPRPGGRAHEGIDILAPFGSAVVSPTQAVVVEVGHNSISGYFVLTANPGGEQFYYAHLAELLPHLKEGTVLSPGDPLGFVGTSGNAKGKTPHLHFGIYMPEGAVNPFPRLTREFTFAEKLASLSTLFRDATLKEGAQGGAVYILQQMLTHINAGPAAQELARVGATGYFGALTRKAVVEFQRAAGVAPANGTVEARTHSFLLASLSGNFFDGERRKADLLPLSAKNDANTRAEAATGTISKQNEGEAQLSEEYARQLAKRGSDLEVGDVGEAVRLLQKFLISQDAGPAARELARAGATGYFGLLTQRALAEYQRQAGISPASGYFGPITRRIVLEQAGSNN
ncbi:MAG: hypothetical protein KatS3mg099_422 [Candidatus Parcubacteria bacterium]|nr:MAG: hypothetical protein KatS3mg099_422 [Candidatus Parcubacteria bacterium]